MSYSAIYLKYLIQKRFFHINVILSIALYIWHTTLCLAYLAYTRSNTADATMYYVASFRIEATSGLGTQSVLYMTSILTQSLGLSYGGVFLVYNIVGFIGVLALTAALQEVTSESPSWVGLLVIFVMFLPGLNFWSSAIGKDALSFFAAGLGCWASLKLRKRYPAFALAIVFMLLARPHIAALMVISLSIGLFVGMKGRVIGRTALMLGSLPIALYVLSVATAYLGFDSDLNAGGVFSYIEKRQGYNIQGGLGIDISGMSTLGQLFAYGYRPLPTEQGNILGIIIGIENLLLLILTITFIIVYLFLV